MGRPRKNQTKFQKLLSLNQATLYRLMAVDVLEPLKDYIEELNRDQLAEGKRADGSNITPPYTNATVKRKRARGQQAEHVTLRDKGDFYESIFTEVYTKAFVLDASDEKTQELRDKYGSILGLNQQSKEKLIQRIKPLFVAAVRKYIGL